MRFSIIKKENGKILEKTFNVPKRFRGALKAIRRDPANCYMMCECIGECPLNYLASFNNKAYAKYSGECFNVSELSDRVKIIIHRD